MEGADEYSGLWRPPPLLFFFFNWAIPGLFFFIFVFSVQLTVNIDQYKLLPMTGFETRTSGIRSDHSTNCATTTAILFYSSSLILFLNLWYFYLVLYHSVFTFLYLASISFISFQMIFPFLSYCWSFYLFLSLHLSYYLSRHVPPYFSFLLMLFPLFRFISLCGRLQINWVLIQMFVGRSPSLACN